MLTSADTGCVLWSYISLPVSNEVNMLTSIDTGCILWSYISLPVSNEVNMLTSADTVVVFCRATSHCLLVMRLTC